MFARILTIKTGICVSPSPKPMGTAPRSSTTGTMDMASGVEEGNYIPQSDGYFNELRYFADCVKIGKKPEIIDPAELEAVLDIIAEVNGAKGK